MKRLNRKGFTLIELLAVITIMGILMLVAIPAVSRTIENTRRDTFASTAKSYIKAMKNSIAADEVEATVESNTAPISALPGGSYYCYKIDSTTSSATDLMEQGGKSAWGNAEVKGYIAVYKTVDDSNKTKYDYAIFLVDSANRGITKLTVESALKRSVVSSKSDVTYRDEPAAGDKFGGEQGEDISGKCTYLSIAN